MNLSRRWLFPARRTFAAALVATLAIAAHAPTAHASATITVTTTADDLTNNGNCTLREAVRAANRNQRVDNCTAGSNSGTDTIRLAAGTYTLTRSGRSENASATGDLDFFGRVRLQGVGAATIVDGGAIDRVLDVQTGSVVTVDGVTVRNGAAVSRGAVDASNVQLANGGAIRNTGTLTLNNSMVADSTTSNNGGGIYSTGKLTLTDSTVRRNEITFYPNIRSQPQNDGGGIYSSGPLSISRSTIESNVADGLGDGGGIFTTNTAVIDQSTIRYNKAINENEDDTDPAEGAGIFNSGNLTLTASVVHDNLLIWKYGGGIANIGGTALIINSTISDNTGEDNSGVYVNGGSVTLNNVTMSFNGLVVDDYYTDSGKATISNTVVSWCSGSVTSAGYNLIEYDDSFHGDCTITGDTTGNILGVSANLLSLQNNGGPTWTHRPLGASPVIDAGNPATPNSSGNACASKDQRGYSRPKDGDGNGNARCDIGAYERSGPDTSGSDTPVSPDELREIEQNANNQE